MMFNEKEPSIVWKEEDLIEIAHDKNAVQSSISKWSLKDDAKRAIDSNLKIEDYAFHTGLENNPWWMVDLEEIQRIEYIKIENRKHAQEKLKTIRIEYSCDKKEWFFIDKSIYEWNNLDSVIIPLYSYIKARYIKVSLEERNYLHFKKMQVFKRKYPGLIVATRFDGFGARMRTFFNAMYIAKKAGLKFGFVWEKREINANNSVFVDSEEEIFSERFLKEHSYTKVLKHYYGDTNIHGRTIADLSDNFLFYYGYQYSCGVNLEHKIFSDLDEKEYLKSFKESWNKIEWNPKIQKVIDEALYLAEEYVDYVALHLRNGDVITTCKEALFNNAMQSRSTPIEIAIYLIEYYLEKGKKIIVFSGDESADIVLEYFKADQNIINVQQISKNYSYMEKIFFDITLMSKSKLIIAPFSAFSIVANNIGGNKLSNYNEILDLDTQLKAFQKFKNVKSLPVLKSLSFSYLFLLSKELNEKADRLVEILKEGYKQDNNLAFIVKMLGVLLENAQTHQAEEIISSFKYMQQRELAQRFFPKFIGGPFCYQSEINQVLSHSSPSYPYISYIAARISLFQKNPTNALKFIQYSLQSQPNNEEFLSCKKEIMSLLPKEETTKTIFKETSPKPTPQELEIKSLKDSLDSTKKQLESQNKFLQSQIKEINFTLHYGTAKDRIHNHLSYKLGKAMIENSKSILGYIRMPYVLSYIKEQHLKEQKQYQEQIKKNPNLKLPKLESYKDYKEALKEKECFTYKLGEAFIRANTLKSKNNINNNTNNISGGGGQILSKPQYLSTLQSILYKPIAYFKFAKEVRELNRELAKKRGEGID